MMKLSKQELASLQCIYEGNNSIIYRQDTSEYGVPVIIKLSKHVNPTPQQIVRFATEYALIKDLDLPGVRKVYDKVSIDDRTALILAYVEGETVRQAFVRQRKSLAEILTMAVAITQALGEVHRNNIIHKNINSHHILVNLKHQTATLIDFSIASQVNLKTRYSEVPEVLEGTLAYISPEQTGRMNRSVDYRTDLYSLGVVLYEMLTGKRPFTTTDASELVHNHIARRPMPVCEVNLDIPQVVSDIVMKLMAKNAEDRYQSAFGLMADLENCLHQLEETDTIQSFELAGEDFSERFKIPQKLYGREQEMNTFIQVFERVRKGASEIMLLSGSAGMGKSWLVHEFSRFVIEKGGYFVSGSCDQYQRNFPHHALVRAFADLVNVILTEGADQLAQWKTEILEKVGGNGQLLLNVVPSLELIIGPQPAVQELSPMESQQRLLQVSLSFLQVIARKEHPLIFLIDDLQWADIASLTFLNLLMSNVKNCPLLFIGVYRDDQVGASHPLTQMVAEMTRQAQVITTVRLENLSHDTVNLLLADTLRCDPSETQALAALILEKTDGNAFIVAELLQSLYEEGMLTFSFETRRWEWDVARIRDTAVTDNMATLMSHKIETLPENTREILMLAACIGNTFTLKTLAAIATQPAKTVFDHLWQAVAERLVLPLDDNYKVIQTLTNVQPPSIDCHFEFSHSRVRQAAYSLISTRHKRSVHLAIGRLRLQETEDANLEGQVFDIADHLNEGFRYIEDKQEKLRLAELNLIAGHKAKNEAAYQAAIWYLSMGIGLLPPDKWDRYYDLTRDLYIEAAEAEYLSNNLERAKLLSEEALEHVRDTADKLKIYKLQILVYKAQTRRLEVTEAPSAAMETVSFLPPTELADRPPVAAGAPTRLDMATVIKASHMLSQEIRLEQLLDKMIHIVIENAGAEKGILIEDQRGKLVVQAKGQVGQQVVETMQGTPIEKSGEVPLSVVNYVARTKTAVVLSDATRDSTFAADRYIAEHQIKSLLCLPIVHQAKLLGLLYLENNLATNVFTPDRLELLQALSSQAAISMQNANLYTSLEEKIRELEQAEQARKNSERRLADIISFLPDITFAIDLNGKIIIWNRAAEAFTGVPARDMLGKGDYEYAIPFYGERRPILIDLLFNPVPEFERLYLNFRREGEMIFGESYTNSAQGSEVYWTAVAAPLYDSQGNMIGAIETIHDITERKQAEEAITLFRTLIDQTNDAIEVMDPETQRFLDANEQAYQSLGYTRDEFLNLTVFDIDPLASGPSGQKALEEILRTGSNVHESVHQRKDGSTFPVEVNVNYIRLDRDYILAVVRDITERKQAEQERMDHLHFLESIGRVNRVLQGANDFEQMMSDVLQIVLSTFDCDRAYLMYPCDPEAAKWIVPMEQNKPEYPGVLELNIEMPMDQGIAETIRSLLAAEGPIKHGPGTPYPVPEKVSKKFGVKCSMLMAIYPKIGSPWQFGMHQCSYARIWTPQEERLFQEIGWRLADALTSLLSYQEVQQSEERYRALYHENPSMFFTLDAEATIISANDFGAGQLGYTKDELEGQPVLNIIYEEDKAAVSEKLKACLQNPWQVYHGQFRKVRKDGSLMWADEFTRTVDGPDGATYILIVCQDISDRKHVEEQVRELNLELEQRVLTRTAELEAANKELEAFAYSVSHDLRAPLRHIDGYMELLQQRCADALDDRSRHYMDTIAHAANHMGQLIDDLLSFSRMSRYELSKRPVDLSNLVQEIIQEYESEIQNRDIRWQIADLPTINGDRSMLRLVLTNLITNALKFTRNCTPAEIEIGYLPGEKESTIFIRDNGVGFDMAYADKLFGVFQRLHHSDEFEGTGIGLANVRRIINRHNGSTWAEGKTDHGATFYFSLPHTEQEV